MSSNIFSTSEDPGFILSTITNNTNNYYHNLLKAHSVLALWICDLIIYNNTKYVHHLQIRKLEAQRG